MEANNLLMWICFVCWFAAGISTGISWETKKRLKKRIREINKIERKKCGCQPSDNDFINCGICNKPLIFIK